VLGVCFGAQLVAHALGAEVTPSEPPEIGFLPVTLTAAGRADPVLGALPERFVACQWHAWRCALPPGSSALADSDACLQGFRAANAWGVQFHPEVDEPTLEGWIAAEPAEPPGFARRRELLPPWNELGRRLYAAFAREVG
jgi:GMP synthase-like glutamine amidotransferase